MATITGKAVNPTAHTSAKPTWPWAVVLSGYFLPCLVGICVWFYLRAMGKPVMPLSWIWGAIPMLIISSFVWVLPFVVVALAAVRIPLAHKKYAGLVYGAFAGTVLFEILVFAYAWLDVEIVVMGVLILPVAVFAGTLAGAIFGLFLGLYFEKTSPTAS